MLYCDEKSNLHTPSLSISKQTHVVVKSFDFGTVKYWDFKNIHIWTLLSTQLIGYFVHMVNSVVTRLDLRLQLVLTF